MAKNECTVEVKLNNGEYVQIRERISEIKIKYFVIGASVGIPAGAVVFSLGYFLGAGL